MSSGSRHVEVFLGFINRPLHKLVYFLSGLFPRNKRLWLVGAQKRSYSCNSKYLFLAAQRELPEGVRCFWVARDQSVFRLLTEKGLPVVYLPSLKGWWYCLRAGVYFVNCDFKDVSLYLSRGAFFFNLWHGIPLKKIQFDDERDARSIFKRRVAEGGRLMHLAFPFETVRYDRVLSTSQYVTDYSFSSAFGVPPESCVALGYPRTDLFFLSRAELLEYVRGFESRELLDLMGWCEGFSKVVVYMPTWRDSKADFIRSAGFDFSAMQSSLEEMDACLVLKMHPNTNIDLDELSRFSSIRVMGKMSDIYPFLPAVDVLITDYSSIFFDFLLLDRELVFFPFDYEEYLSDCRDLYLEYDEVTPGVKAYDFPGLLEELKHPSKDYSEMRREVRERFWGAYAGDASSAIIESVLRDVGVSHPV